MLDHDNETWLLDAADEIIRRQTEEVSVPLSDYERLIYSLWLIDYSIRNAGDLQAMGERTSRAVGSAAEVATRLGLRDVAAFFEGGESTIIEEYIDRFDSLCESVRVSGLRS